MGNMGVGVQGKPGGVVSQYAGQSLGVHTALHGQGGEGVPEVVEPHAGVNARGLQQLFVDTRDRLRAPHPARLG